MSAAADMPEAYRWWRATAWRLLEPLVRLLPPVGSEPPLRGPASDHDANADRLEAFARPCLLAALWLQAVPGDAMDPGALPRAATGGALPRAATDGAPGAAHGGPRAVGAAATDGALPRAATDGAADRAAIAAWFRQALVRGADPASPHYWGPNASYHQNGVEMGLLVIALKVAAGWLWEPLDKAEQRLVGRWLASNRGTGHHWNNHLFFGILALEFLRDIGMDRRSDAPAIAAWFAEMERMYRGRGWFMDGMNQACDHYNAYAFHFYGPLWAWLYGHRDPPRAARWKEWCRQFLVEYEHAFAASGEHPAFGRSITYRWNASAPFAAAALADACPVPLGRARRLLTRNLAFFLGKPVFQEQGALALGWHDAFPQLAEKYSCAGSPYWAAKSFIGLALPPAHPFWQEPEEPYAAEKADFARPMPDAGLLIRSVHGEVEILNAGSAITPVNKEKFGAWKWGKLAYRTGTGFTIGRSDDAYSPDLGLTARGGARDRVYGRHFTTPFALAEDHLGAVYALGDKHEQINCVVETLLWWRAGWLLQLHLYDNCQELELTVGGYPLSAADPQAFVRAAAADHFAVWAEGRGTALQRVAPGAAFASDERLDGARSRTHVQQPWHVTPLLRLPPRRGPGWLAALCWAGRDRAEAASWHITAGAAGRWRLQHELLGDWTLRHEALPAIPPAT